jgi:pantoate--beta-alanine ligase
MSISTFTDIAALRSQIWAWRAAGERIAFVPTMGNLHEGHLSLIHVAKKHAQRVIASIFVNPTQFGPNEDFLTYPRTLAADQQLLADGGCDAVFAPSVEVMYPTSEKVSQSDTEKKVSQSDTEKTSPFAIDVGAIGTILCGAVRPGHYSGVATVVAKLFNIVQADVAIFGEKDFQQLIVLRKMAQQFNFPIEIIGAPTVREANGLARSSRNQYLSRDEREHARVIYATLLQMRDMRVRGVSQDQTENAALSTLNAAGLQPDYAVIKDAQTLDFIGLSTKSEVALIAARLGRARLIDNVYWVK